MEKTLFVLNQDLSGINSFMFDSLRARGWRVHSWDIRLPPRQRTWLAGRSFHPDRAVWKRRYHRALSLYGMSPRGLAQKTKLCSREVTRRAAPNDLVLVIGTHFNPDDITFHQPYVTFKDYTSALAARNYPEWIPVAAADAVKCWLDAEARVCRGAILNLTASENTRRSLIEDYDVAEEKVAVVGEGLCFAGGVPPLKERGNDKKHVLFVGREFERKGGETVLRAFARLRDEHQDSRLFILGPERRAIVPPGVEWVGPVQSRDAVRGYFADAAVFALPSYCEPFGLVFLEAMACGLPCIGSTRDAMPEIIVDGVTGYLVEPGAVETLRDKIHHLFVNPHQARAMGRRGYERVVSRYLWSHVAERIDAALAMLIEARGS